MKMNKYLHALLFPHPVLLGLLTLISIATLPGAMIAPGSETIPAFLSYALAAYTLAVWCFRIPRIIRVTKAFQTQNALARRWTGDPRFRIQVSLALSLLWNTAYAVFQLALGIRHRSLWYGSLAGYYASLSLMRLFLSVHARRYQPREQLEREWRRYRICGWLFLLTGLALSVMIFLMVYLDRTFHHHQITAIAMAAYTFTSLTLAIIGLLRYRKYNSPVFSASKAISLAAACVSMLTLASTMLTAFGMETTVHTRRLTLGSLGLAVSLLILAMAVYMICHSTKHLHTAYKENTHEPTAKQ